ncbi:aldehyde dehydrogenase family protein, partial [Yersinia pestis PY-42]
MLPRKGLS